MLMYKKRAVAYFHIALWMLPKVQESMDSLRCLRLIGALQNLEVTIGAVESEKFLGYG